MVEIKLKRRYKIGSSWCGSFDTKNLSPKRLMYIMKNLPEDENVNRYLILSALNSGDYTRNRSTLYIIPPITVEKKLVTHIVLYKKKKCELEELLDEVQIQTPTNLTLIRKLETAINNLAAIKSEKMKREREREKDEEIVMLQSQLPFKKRAII